MSKRFPREPAKPGIPYIPQASIDEARETSKRKLEASKQGKRKR